MCEIKPLTDDQQTYEVEFAKRQLYEMDIGQRKYSKFDERRCKMIFRWQDTVEARDKRIAELEEERHRLRVMLDIEQDPDMER